MSPVGEPEASEQSSRPNLYSVAGFKILPRTLHLVVRIACLLLPVVHLVRVIRTDKIVDECLTDYIYLAALSHNIRNKKGLKKYFFKVCPY